MKAEKFGGIFGASIVFAFFVLYAVGAYQIVTEDKYTGKDVAVALVIFPYPAWVGAKEVYFYANGPASGPSQTSVTQEPASRRDKLSTATHKGHLWDVSMDALQVVIDVGKRPPSSQAEADSMKEKLLAALEAAKAFSNETKFDYGMEVVAFRKHYLIGVQGMVDGLTAHDTAVFKQGASEVDAFLDLMQSRPVTK